MSDQNSSVWNPDALPTQPCKATSCIDGFEHYRLRGHREPVAVPCRFCAGTGSQDVAEGAPLSRELLPEWLAARNRATWEKA